MAMAFWRKKRQEDATVGQEPGRDGLKEVRGASKNTAFGVLRSPRITEKAAQAGEQNVYVFSVSETAGKPQIRRAVEERYRVSIRTVRTARLPGKERRRGRQIGWKPGLKKAMVQVKEGQKIEVQ